MLQKIFRSRATSIIHDFIKNNDIKENFILPANICPIVPLVFYKNKVKIKFVDIDKKTLNMCEDRVFSEIKNSSGILWNYSYGKETDQKKFFLDLKKKKENFLIIDDKCLCIPELNFRKKIISDLEIYSTGYSKYCDLGYGGFGLSKKKFKLFKTNYLPADEKKVKEKINKAILQKNIYVNKYNKWLNNDKIINKQIYLNKVKKLKKEIFVHKKNINNIYIKNLPPEIILDKQINNWRFNILVNEKKILLKKIFLNGLFASSHFYSSSRLFNNEKKKNTEALNKIIVNLFNDSRFNESKAYQICEIVNMHYKKYGSSKKL